MKRRLAVIGIMVVAALALAGCFGPLAPIVDPDDPVVPVLTIPVAAFSYYSTEYPVQTDSRIRFDARASYDPDGEIMWGRWDFGETPTVFVEGPWVRVERQWEDGQWVWKEIPLMQEEFYEYDEVGLYSVVLTVWDYDGNQASTTHSVRVR
jgi:hypothetical protein